MGTILSGVAALAGCRGSAPAQSQPAQAATTSTSTSTAPTVADPPSAASSAAAAETPDYGTKLAEWVEAHQEHPTEDNRWPLFVDATSRLAGAWEVFALTDGPLAKQIMEDSDQHPDAASPISIINTPYSARFIPELRKFFEGLDRTKILFDIDHVAAPSRFVALRATEPLIQMDMPEMGEARVAVRLCVARMRLSLLDKHPEQAVRSFAHALAIARAVQGRGALIGYLVSVACWSAAANEVNVDLLDGRIDSETAKQMLALMEGDPGDPRLAYGGERYFALDIIERFFDKTKEETQQAMAGGLTPAQREEIDRGLGVLASREQQVAEANRFFDGCHKVFGPDAAERERGRAEIDAAYEHVGIDPSTGNEKQSPGAKMFKPLTTILPVVGKIRQAQLGTMMRQAGVRTMLALETFRARNGHYPEKLEELVPSDLNALPMDPFAENVPLRYKRLLAAGGTAATGYVLYSVGADGEDNGGKPHPANPANATGPSGRGYDAIINTRVW